MGEAPSNVFAFGEGASVDTLSTDVALVGGKAASLALMTALHLSVPPGVVIAVPRAREIAMKTEEAALDAVVDHAIGWIERATGRSLGATSDALALAVRGGAARSMPGALPTVLDVTDRVALRDAILTVARAHEGSAVIVQAMVRGSDGDGGAAVALTRDPRTGVRVLSGEWIAGGRGRDLADGRTVPGPIGGTTESLEARMPDLYAELARGAYAIEERLGDVAEIELTVERGKLWFLQARPAAVSPRARVRIAVELANEGIIDRETAVSRVPQSVLDALVRRVALDPESLALQGVTPIGTGLPASAGTATGVVVLDPDEAVEVAAAGARVILVRRDASTEDVAGMRAASGILTSSGGLTSHAAVVARALGKPCVTGAVDIHVDYARRRLTGRARPAADAVRAPAIVERGAIITIDGSRGHVYVGEIPTVRQHDVPELGTLLAWADEAESAR